MTKQIATAKTSTVNQSAPPPHPALSVYCKDFDDWPRRWMFMEKDIPVGQQMLACFRPFLEHLIGLDLSRKTIRKHADNLWFLDGELIRGLPETPSPRKRAVQDLVFDAVEGGGILPYHHHSEEELRSFESTCRKSRRFLEQQPR
jgi:hypothetical protein